MATIYVDKGEDPLKVYKRYRKQIWYKRVTKKQWFMIGVGVGLFGLLAPHAWNLIMGLFGNGLLGFLG